MSDADQTDIDAPTDPTEERARSLYFNALFQLKLDCEYTQRYRDHLASWLQYLTLFRAIVSVGALGSWIGGLGAPMLWGAVIAASQVAEVVQTKLPLAARERGLRSAVTALDAALIDAAYQWEMMQIETPSPKEITKRWRLLLKAKQEIEAKNLSLTGLPRKAKLFALAQQATKMHFAMHYAIKDVP